MGGDCETCGLDPAEAERARSHDQDDYTRRLDRLRQKIKRLEARAVERVKFEDALVDKTLERAAMIAEGWPDEPRRRRKDAKVSKHGIEIAAAIRADMKGVKIMDECPVCLDQAAKALRIELRECEGHYHEQAAWVGRLKQKLARAIEQDYCTICGRILGEVKDE